MRVRKLDANQVYRLRRLSLVSAFTLLGSCGGGSPGGAPQVPMTPPAPTPVSTCAQLRRLKEPLERIEFVMGDRSRIEPRCGFELGTEVSQMLISAQVGHQLNVLKRGATLLLHTEFGKSVREAYCEMLFGQLERENSLSRWQASRPEFYGWSREQDVIDQIDQQHLHSGREAIVVANAERHCGEIQGGRLKEQCFRALRDLAISIATENPSRESLLDAQRICRGEDCESRSKRVAFSFVARENFKRLTGYGIPGPEGTRAVPICAWRDFESQFDFLALQHLGAGNSLANLAPEEYYALKTYIRAGEERKRRILASVKPRWTDTKAQIQRYPRFLYWVNRDRWMDTMNACVRDLEEALQLDATDPAVTSLMSELETGAKELGEGRSLKCKVIETLFDVVFLELLTRGAPGPARIVVAVTYGVITAQ